MSEYVEFPMIDNTVYAPTNGEVDHYQEMFPNINVSQEFCSMQVWLEANPARRKTKRGISRFIASWLIKASRDQQTPNSVRRESQVGKHWEARR